MTEAAQLFRVWQVRVWQIRVWQAVGWRLSPANRLRPTLMCGAPRAATPKVEGMADAAPKWPRAREAGR